MNQTIAITLSRRRGNPSISTDHRKKEIRESKTPRSHARGRRARAIAKKERFVRFVRTDAVVGNRDRRSQGLLQPLCAAPAPRQRRRKKRGGVEWSDRQSVRNCGSDWLRTVQCCKVWIGLPRCGCKITWGPLKKERDMELACISH